ncbi:hypothetical protein VUR80DRAFT_5495 [Thermomyces stellatus]
MGMVSAIIAAEVDMATQAPLYACVGLSLLIAAVSALFLFEPFEAKSIATYSQDVLDRQAVAFVKVEQPY